MTSPDSIRAALAYVPAHDRETWLRMAMAVKAELGDDGFDVWSEWSAQDESYTTSDAKSVWKSVSPNGKVGIATLFYEAKQRGYQPLPAARAPSAAEISERERNKRAASAADETHRKRHRDEAASKAIRIWEAAAPASADHPYLLRKCVQPVTTLRELDARTTKMILGYLPKQGDISLTGRLLIVPVKIDDNLSTLELIDETGNKSAVAGGVKRSGYWASQTLPDGDGEGLTLLIGEGVATVLSTWQATEHPGVAALSAGNLSLVTGKMRQRYPRARLVVLADLGAGEEDAHKAARDFGALVAVPEFGDNRLEEDKDFNDMYRLRGQEAVASAVERAAASPDSLEVSTPQPSEKNGTGAVLEGGKWPEPLAPEAMHGLAGEIMQAIEPDTESDPAAMLLQTLVAFGALVARGPHVRVEGDEHHTNLFVLVVGDTSKGRKGTSWGRVRQLFGRIQSWKPTVSGLSSGEGLKFNVRDPVQKLGKNGLGEQVLEFTDAGITDKRLLVIEPEFAQALRVAARPGNTLSATVREAWDTGRLATLTKNDPITATGAHVCIIGHITSDELRAELTATDTASGFANRFLFVGARRSKVLPFGGANMPDDVAEAFAQRVERAAVVAQTRGALAMTPAAREVWTKVYPALSEGHTGLLGAATARAEAQCIRLALLYALLDEADAIDSPHLLAALAVWEYCDATARHVFGASLGDRIADEIMRALKVAGLAGRSRTEIRDLFKRHQNAERIGQALELLTRRKLVRVEQRQTGGRPEEIWTAEGAT